jgi:hypothetical protein
LPKLSSVAVIEEAPSMEPLHAPLDLRTMRRAISGRQRASGLLLDLRG